MKSSNGLETLHLKNNSYLSKGGGDVMVGRKQDGTSVLFFTFRGVLDNFSGFIYCPKPNKSCVDNFIYEDDKLQEVHLSEHWYWAASH